MKRIEFYIPEREIIPTKLRLIIEKDEGKDITVYYERLEESFGYNFELYDITSEDEAKEIISQIAEIMCNQSYDHGQEWRVENIEKLSCDINNFISKAEYNVLFRIRDMY